MILFLIIIVLIFCGLATDTPLGVLFSIVFGCAAVAVICTVCATSTGAAGIKRFNELIENAAKAIYDLVLNVPEYNSLCKIRDDLKESFDYSSVIENLRTIEKHPVFVGSLKGVYEAQDEFLRILDGIKVREGKINYHGNTIPYQACIKAFFLKKWEEEKTEKYIAVADEICALI